LSDRLQASNVHKIELITVDTMQNSLHVATLVRPDYCFADTSYVSALPVDLRSVFTNFDELRDDSKDLHQV
jgi:hypothetical protein